MEPGHTGARRLGRGLLPPEAVLFSEGGLPSEQRRVPLFEKHICMVAGVPYSRD